MQHANLEALFKIEESPAAQKAIAEHFGDNFRRIQVDANPSAKSTTLIRRGDNNLVTRTEQRFETFCRVTRLTNACLADCKCICHHPKYTTTGRLLSPLFGFGLLEMKGIPFFRYSCTVAACKPSNASSLHVSYRFPNWFAQRILYLLYTSSPIGSPAALIRMARVFEWDSEPVNILWQANTDISAAKTLRSKVVQGLISPYDELPSGASILCVSRLSGDTNILCADCLVKAHLQLAEDTLPFAIDTFRWVLDNGVDASQLWGYDTYLELMGPGCRLGLERW